MDYENKSNWTLGQSKPNSNPIKPNFQKAKMNVNLTLTKDYRKKDDFLVRINKANFRNGQNERKLTYNKGLQKKRCFRSPKNKPNSNPISVKKCQKCPIYLPAIDLFQLYQRDPVFIGFVGCMANGDPAGAGYLGYGALLQLAAGTWIIPLYGEGAGVIAQVKTRSAAGRQIYCVDSAGFGKAVIVLGGSQFIVVGHLGKGQVLAEKLQGVSSHIPHMLSAAPILAIEVVVGEFVAEVPFHAGPAGHQIAP